MTTSPNYSRTPDVHVTIINNKSNVQIARLYCLGVSWMFHESLSIELARWKYYISYLLVYIDIFLRAIRVSSFKERRPFFRKRFLSFSYFSFFVYLGFASSSRWFDSIGESLDRWTNTSSPIFTLPGTYKPQYIPIIGAFPSREIRSGSTCCLKLRDIRNQFDKGSSFRWKLVWK